MAGHDEKYLDDAASFILGLPDPAELKAFESHLAGCERCGKECARLAAAAALLPRALPPSFVPPELKERILFTVRLAQVARAHFGETGQTVPVEEIAPEPAGPAQGPVRQIPVVRKGRPWLAFGLAIAVIVMLAGFSLYINALMTTIGNLNEYVSTQQGQIARLVEELDRRESVLKVFESPRIVFVALDALRSDPSSYGSIVWDPSRRRAILHTGNLPATPPDKNYQLWIMEDQRAISAGVFTIASGKEEESFFRVQPVDVTDSAQVSGFMVTLEIKGGAPAPSGETYLTGRRTR